MFKRGTHLPARPSIPNKDEILADLNTASSDDVIYRLREQYVSNDNKLSKQTYEDNELYEFEVTPATSYLKIDSFLNKMSYLKDYLITLAEQKANLRRLEENLLEEMLSMKKELNTDTS